MGKLVNLEAPIVLTPPTKIIDDFSTSSIRTIQPDNVLKVYIELRKFMAAVETTAFTLYSSFEEVGAEPEAEKARHTLELATARVASLLAALEKTPEYQEVLKSTKTARANKK